MLLTLSREMHVPAFGGVREVDRSLGSLSRHPSFRRAVCVDAHVRICAGATSDGRPYRDHNKSESAQITDPIPMIRHIGWF
jgi:hypothetical protein